jgi:hypothetical protein
MERLARVMVIDLDHKDHFQPRSWIRNRFKRLYDLWCHFGLVIEGHKDGIDRQVPVAAGQGERFGV